MGKKQGFGINFQYLGVLGQNFNNEYQFCTAEVSVGETLLLALFSEGARLRMLVSRLQTSSRLKWPSVQHTLKHLAVLQCLSGTSFAVVA